MAEEISISEFSDSSGEPAVRGFLHTPARATGDALILTHGAGADCRSRLLAAMAAAFVEAGCLVLRCDLPFRQERPHGPPFPGGAARDREGLRRAVNVLSKRARGRIFLGGHSYGGRQATMLASESRDLVAGLVLLSYPLHPPRKPSELRTSHFPRLNAPALFVHGSRDPFGSLEEMKQALPMIAARTSLLEVEGAGHDLLARKGEQNSLPARTVEAFKSFFGK